MKTLYYNFAFTDLTYYHGCVFNLADVWSRKTSRKKTQVTYWYVNELVFTSWAHHWSYATALRSASLQSEKVPAPRVESIHHKETPGGTGV